VNVEPVNDDLGREKTYGNARSFLLVSAFGNNQYSMEQQKNRTPTKTRGKKTTILPIV
jgi:predicted Fe-Mo cluster-binding NifX family protein